MAGYSSASGTGSTSEDFWDDLPRASKRESINSLSRRSRILSIEEVATKQEPKWTVRSGAQNLATALNDPSSREVDLFTRTWGSYFIPTAPIPPSNFPSIQLGDFLRYLKDTARGRKVHRGIMRDLKKQTENTTPTSPAVIAPLVAKLNEGGKTYDLSSVPRVFMQTDFSLEDPPTFKEVIPLSELFPTKGGGAKVGVAGQVNQSTQLLHEKLTHYLDIIEVHLAHQISQRADVFFETLSSQQDLQSLIANVRLEVVELRQKIRQLDKVSTHQVLKLLRAFMRLLHLSLTVDKLKLIIVVQQTQPNIQSLLGTSDFVGALELISTTQEVLSQELQGVHALRHLSSQLSEMERAIGKMMEGDFVKFCLEDIKQRIREATCGGAESTETEERLVSVTYGLLRQRKLHFLTALRESLLSFLKAEVKDILNDHLNLTVGDEAPSLTEKMKELDFDPWLALLAHVFDCLIHHLAAVQASVKVIAGVCERAVGNGELILDERSPSPPPEPKTPPTDLPPPSLAYMPMESLEVQEAEDRLEQMLLDDELSDTRLGLSLTTDLVGVNQSDEVDSIRSKEELQSSRTVAMPTTKEATEDPSAESRVNDCAGSEGAVISHDTSHTLLVECEDVLSAACDLIHGRCAKILSIRAKAGKLEDLIPSEFVALVRLVEKFVSRSIQLTGRQCPQLRSSLLSQGKKFLEHFHTQRMGKISLLLDGERWKQVEVPAEIQSMASRLEAGIEPPSKDETQLKPPEVQPPSNKLFIHGQQFAVVGIVLLLIKVVVEYCSCADDLPMLITDVLSRLVEVFKKFNSRTCDLVLGAGAMMAVGLKMITARHLALSTRCLEAVMLIIPDVKRHFKVRLAPKQHVLLSQFDQVIEDISSHCQRTNVKVMNIMDTMILKQLDKWEAKSPVPSVPFKNLVKQIVKLHDNLVDILPPEQLQALFVGIERMFTGHLQQKLLHLGITNNGSTQHGIVNSELSHFKGSLSSLEDVKAFGSSLFDVWTGLR